MGLYASDVVHRPAEYAATGGSESLLQPAGVNAELLQELRAAVQAAVASEPTANGKERSTGLPLRPCASSTAPCTASLTVHLCI